MAQQVNVKVTERGGSYFTSKVQGKASSCTYSAEVAVASLAQKLFPGQQLTIDQVDKHNWTITMKGEFNQLSAAEALMVEALADFGKHNDPDRLNPNATPLKTRLVEIAQRVFGEVRSQCEVNASKGAEL
ncbi:hypothetical protein [Rheinheimera faecalis]|uniref:hypothetical protein n=1 Tax=Rheinheimera faecalis TaxID=2901141 RepID=UPI001E2F0A49|nr:hypothetical protein [Rheinheimera faecalis]